MDKNNGAVADPIEGELVQVQPDQSGEIATQSLYGTMTVGQLKKATSKMAEQRKVITEYVREQLVEGVDFGRIHINKNCPNKYEPKKCKVEGHFSKPVLFKPGQEKIFSLFNLTAKLYRDVETLEMVGNPEGLVALICKVYRNNVEIAEGRGAAKIGDNSRDANATIKIAEKRARMDACLSLGFSEFFTQDIEDPEYRGLAEGGDSSADTKSTTPATIKQKNLISKLFLERGANTPNLLLASIKANGVAEPKDMTMQEASDLIEKLFANNADVVTSEPVSREEQEFNEEMFGRGPGDPDVHGYPGEEVIEDELSDEEIAQNLAEAEAKLLGDDEEGSENE